jgi:outer membrane protein W
MENSRMIRKCFPVMIGASLLLAGAVQAQPGMKLGIFSYGMSLPTGDAKDYTDNDSWLNLSFEGQYMMKTNVSLGFMFAWNELYANTTELIPLESGAIWGDQYRDLNIFPMTAGAQYYFGEGKGATAPYVGLYAGAYYIRQILDIGLSSFTKNNWHFGVAPQIGVLVPTGSHWGRYANLSVRYNYPIEGGDYLGGKSKSFNYVTFSIGIGQTQ